MFAKIVILVPLLLPQAASTPDHQYSVYAYTPELAAPAPPLVIERQRKAMVLDLTRFLPPQPAQPVESFSHYRQAPSLQQLVHAGPAQADFAARASLPPTFFRPGRPQQLPPGGYSLTTVTEDLAWRRETAAQLREILE